MEQSLVAARVVGIFKAIESLIPEYLSNPLDQQIARGNVAVCIIDAHRTVYRKMFEGTGDKLRQRESYRVAWVKASQVWITEIKTFEYEKFVLPGKSTRGVLALMLQILLDGRGQPLSLDSETLISVGFSGFRGTSDLEIVQRALELTAE